MDWVAVGGFCLAILVQTFYLVRWGSRIGERLIALEKRMDKRDQEQKALEVEVGKADGRLVRMETLMEGFGTMLTKLDTKQDRTFEAISALSGSVRVLNENALRAIVPTKID